MDDIIAVTEFSSKWWWNDLTSLNKGNAGAEALEKLHQKLEEEDILNAAAWKH